MGKEISDKVEITRQGKIVLMVEQEWVPYVDHYDVKTLNNRDIGKGALKAGYEDGDSFTYKIIIEKNNRR